MAKTMFHVRQDGTQFYLNTESSSPSTGHRNRYRLFKTENFGRDKAGWVQVGSQVGQQLIAIGNDTERFEACDQAFSAKRPHQYQVREQIRGRPGKWEGEAFAKRLTAPAEQLGAQDVRRKTVGFNTLSSQEAVGLLRLRGSYI